MMPDRKLQDITPASSEAWIHHKKKMERLGTAVKHAIAVASSQAETTLQSDTPPVDSRAVNISFNDGLCYTLPWEACRTWRVRMHRP